MSDAAKGGPLGHGAQTDRMIGDESCTKPVSGAGGGADAERSDQQSAEMSTLKTTIAQLASMIIF